MTEKIIDAYLGLAALREAGYRSTATAVAELVDNSIEANAKNIEIIALSKDNKVGNRTSTQVEGLAVLDDGIGMPVDVLARCLSMGWGSRLDGRSGLGRYGFGLKGSSISQARRVDVYTWQSGSPCNDGEVFATYLDLDEIKEQGLSELPEPIQTKLPSWAENCFSDKLGDSGTLVYWSRLDKVDLKRTKTLISRMDRELCRIYRHFLDDDDCYGEQVSCFVHDLNWDTMKITDSKQLKANDPLYLLSPNNVPGREAEATNDEFARFTVPIAYSLGGPESISDVEFIFSCAKPEIQKLGGNSPVGQHYAKNTGISFVRAGREIDFGDFGFLEASEPRHRWWGAEVRFEPVLDELFGLTNNKQSVRSVKKFDAEVLAGLVEDGDYKAKLLVELNKVLSEQISEMMRIIKSRGSSNASEKRERKALVDAVNREVQPDTTVTESAERAATLTEEVKLEERVALLVSDDSTLTTDQAKKLARETLDYRVDVQTAHWPGSLVLDRRAVANASVGIVNRNTKFYEQFWCYLETQSDKKGFEALEVMIMALVRAEDEMVRRGGSEMLEAYRERWGYWIEQLIEHAGD